MKREKKGVGRKPKSPTHSLKLSRTNNPPDRPDGRLLRGSFAEYDAGQASRYDTGGNAGGRSRGDGACENVQPPLLIRPQRKESADVHVRAGGATPHPERISSNCFSTFQSDAVLRLPPCEPALPARLDEGLRFVLQTTGIALPCSSTAT